MAHILQHLGIHEFILAIDVQQVFTTQIAQVVVFRCFHDMLALLLSVAVHNDVMGNTCQPERELAAVCVFAFLQLGDNLDKSVLEHIVSQLRVTDHEQNVVVELLLIASQ